MKKLKKLTALLASVIVFANIAVLHASANDKILVYKNNVNINYTLFHKADEIEELIVYPIGDVYQSDIIYDSGSPAFVGVAYNDAHNTCSTIEVDIYAYCQSVEEDYQKVVEYINEKYPTFTMEDGIIIYNEEFTFDEKLEIAIDIKNNTGISPDIYFLDDIKRYLCVGDLTTDNAITPTDAANLLSYYADMQSGVAVASAEGSVDYSIIGDFNNDGKITPSDAAGILEYYAEKQTEQ